MIRRLAICDAFFNIVFLLRLGKFNSLKDKWIGGELIHVCSD